MAAQPRSSAAVMLVRDGSDGLEVFMVRRVVESDFMPDVYVFPGGSVQADDREAELAEGVSRPVPASASDPEGRTAPGAGLRVAAIRELFEEAGVLLAYSGADLLAVTEANRAALVLARQELNERRGSLLALARTHGLELATERLAYFSHWITPAGMPKRFDTHFFLAVAPGKQQADFDRLETSEGVWIAPSVALEQHEQGRFPLVFATIHQLRELAAFATVSQALQAAASAPVPTRAPVLVERDGQAHVHLPGQPEQLWLVPEKMTASQPSAAPLPAYTLILAPNPSLMSGPGTNTIVLGRPDADGALVIDPADADPAHLAAIVAEGEWRGGIRAILITHGHLDHVGGAVELRTLLGGVPIYAFSREGAPVLDREARDGATWRVGGDTLRAIHTPGHRFDHLCFYLEGARLLFAGDQLSGITTNVIAPPEGDMRAYMDSLGRLLSLDLATIIPAHGRLITRPRAKLAGDLAHRLQREQQILTALRELGPGSTIAQLVARIYVDVEPELHPVAAWTVEAHLLKLEQEGAVVRQGEGWRIQARPAM